MNDSCFVTKSDIFTALIDADDWMIGEDCYTPGTAGEALRYMDNPTIGDQPDHMDDYLDTGSDNGGVQTNSGIPNKAAYLMADGGTHHGISVTGMGRNNMGRVFYSANSYYLQSYDGFVQARKATIDAVQNEFPGDTQKENTVKAAWDAVGVAAFSISLRSDINDAPLSAFGHKQSEDLGAENRADNIDVNRLF